MEGQHEPAIKGVGVRKIGESVVRKEDDRYLRGDGQYSDDLNKLGQAYGVFVRSPYAHAILQNIDTTEAKAVPGVVAVLTGQDYADDGHGPVLHRAIEGAPEDWRQRAFGGDDPVAIEINQWPLPTDKARHVGEPVALVVGKTIAAAEEGAERVVIDWRELSAVIDIDQAAAADAPLVSDQVPGNLAVHHYRGNAEQTEAALADSDIVVEGEFFVPRVVGGQIEPRSGIGEYDTEANRFIVTAGNQGVHRYRDMIAGALKVEASAVRVVCPDVGGGFGPRGHVGPEYVALAWAAKRLGRPVKWTSTRVEAFVSDWQGRDMVLKGKLGIARDGKINAYQLAISCNKGAHTICYAPPANASRLVTTVYDIPAASLDLKVYLTNTVPVLPYRAAGRPETTLAIERLIDMAAKEAGLDRHHMRQLNIIKKDAMPYETAMGLSYDLGDFPQALSMVAEMIDWPGYEARRHEAATRGKLRGIALSPYVETPVGAPFEMGRLDIEADGRTVIHAGTQVHGQGHETTYAQVVSEQLGIPFEKITMAWGDSDQLAIGGGTHSDRSMRMMGTILVRIVEDIVDKTKPIAAGLMQAEAENVAFNDGKFEIADTGQQVDFIDVVSAYIESQGGGILSSEARQEDRIKAFPYGASAVEVEIDPETGDISIRRYCIVDDCGQAVNPMIVHGQVAGGIVQGAGQALGEIVTYDLNSGQVLSGSFMDYVMPRADQFPAFEIDSLDVPTESNPLGIKAGGEAGTVPALAVVANAVMDALSPLGVKHFDMPYTAARIWQAVKDQAGSR